MFRLLLSTTLMAAIAITLSVGASAPTGTAVKAASPAPAAPVAAVPTAFRRLNEAQFINSIRDFFGADIKIPGRFDPSLREEGLLAIGDAHVSITPSSVEQIELRARDIAGQVMAKERRDKFLSCAATDAACAMRFFAKYGRMLYRRPLEPDEIALLARVANSATKISGDFHKGIEAGLARMLSSPNFLFRVEWATLDSATGTRRLDDYSLATRISFLLWNAPPDEALLDAAAAGELRDQPSLGRQVDRMLASPKFEQGVRAFFSDMFAYDGFDGLSKDQSLFPIYTSQIAKDAREQTLRTIVDLLLTNRGDFRDLFTTRKTFMNRNLGALYGVPVETGAVGDWAPHIFGPGDQRAGLLTFAAFLMLDPTHEARTSPTTRGKALRELFLCQIVPPPAGNVDFTEFEATKGGFKTVRERLTPHRENPTYAGCHAITDPIGLAMENYDTIGNYRTMETGVRIDASGDFDGKPFQNAIELQKLLRDSPTAPNCVTQRVYEYGVGRAADDNDEAVLRGLQEQFAKERYGFVALMRMIATSDVFRAVAPQKIASK